MLGQSGPGTVTSMVQATSIVQDKFPRSIISKPTTSALKHSGLRRPPKRWGLDVRPRA
jgi:hypothetical protein